MAPLHHKLYTTMQFHINQKFTQESLQFGDDGHFGCHRFLFGWRNWWWCRECGVFGSEIEVSFTGWKQFCGDTNYFLIKRSPTPTSSTSSSQPTTIVDIAGCPSSTTQHTPPSRPRLPHLLLNINPRTELDGEHRSFQLGTKFF